MGAHVSSTAGGRGTYVQLSPQLGMQINRTSPAPLWMQVAHSIEEELARLSLPGSTLVEDEGSLARGLNVSRSTTRQAVRHLVDKGLLVRIPGYGTATPALAPGSFDLNDDTRGTRLGLDVSVESYRVLDITEAPLQPGFTSFDTAELSMQTLLVRRIGLIADSPCGMFADALLAQRTQPGDDEFETVSLLDALERDTNRVRTVHRRFAARQASAEEAALLHLDHGSPVLVQERLLLNSRSTPVSVGVHVFPAGIQSGAVCHL